MAESKPRLKEIAGEYHGLSHFGVVMVSGMVPEDKMGHSPDCQEMGCEVQHLEIFPHDLVSMRLRCNICGTVFDVNPQSDIPGDRKIPLCPKECNIGLLEKWVEEQERQPNQ